MDLSTLNDKLPFLAVVAGALLLLWSQKSKIFSFVANLRPVSKVNENMKPAKRFETFYALRSWCEHECHADAVSALDDKVLSVIVCSDGDKK